MHIHDFDLAFCVKSNLPGWEDLSPADVLSSLRKRVAGLTESDVFDAVGFLDTFKENCYMAEFPGGIFAFLSDAELADSRYYQVLDGVSDAVALFNSGVVQTDSSKGEKP